MKKIAWVPTIFILGYHLALLIGLPIYLTYCTTPVGIYLVAFALLYACGLSITVGYHRYFSHKSYETNAVIETIILFFASLSAQGSALKWASDHRIHHAYVDTDKDPYSINKGFWFAHVLWLFWDAPSLDKKVVPDLMKNPRVMWQHEYHIRIFIIANIFVWLFFGWLFQAYLASFVWIWWVRLFFLHHSTWFINSLAHYWGSKEYSREHSAMDNYIISLLTFGEGYHNYHHTFANDYRNGVKWYHYDPSKWIIWTLSKLGLAKNLRKTRRFRIEEKIILARKAELLDRLRGCLVQQKDKLEEAIETMSKELLEKLSLWKELLQKQKELQKKNQQELAQTFKDKVGEVRSAFKQDCKKWQDLSKRVMRITVPA